MIRLTTCILLIGMLLTACRDAQPPYTEDGKKILRFYILLISTRQVEYYQWAEQTFEARNPDVDVVIEQFPGVSLKDFEVKLRLRFASRTAPDVFQVHENVAAELAHLDLLMPAPPHIKRMSDENALNKMAREAPYFNGTSYGITNTAIWQAMYYNKAMFREAGLDPERPPETWDELIDYAEKLTQRDEEGRLTRAGFFIRKTGYKTGTSEKFFTFLYSAGGEPFNEAGTRATLNTEAGRRALGLYKTVLFDKELDATYLEGDQQGFGQGKVAMLFREAHVISWLEENYPDLEYGVAPIPADQASITSGGSYLFLVNRDTPHAETAWKWVEFLMGDEAYAEYASIGGVMPSTKSVASLPEYRDDPHISIFLNQGVAPTPAFPNVVRAGEILGAYLERFCYGQIELEEMLIRAEEDVNAILYKNR